MTDHDITEIADARYMGLMCPPASPEAKVLVADIINIIEQSEQRHRARKAKDKAAFRLAVGLITGDLLIAMEVKENGWSYHPLSSGTFGTGLLATGRLNQLSTRWRLSVSSAYRRDVMLRLHSSMKELPLLPPQPCHQVQADAGHGLHR